MNQKNHENEKQYEIYWNEKRTLALQIANWAKNSTDYPAEAVTRFLRQYGGGDIFGRLIAVHSVVIDTIALVNSSQLTRIDNRLLAHAANDQLFQEQ